MKTLVLSAIAAASLAGAAQATSYKCEFAPQYTRGWASPVIYFDTANSKMTHFGEVVGVNHSQRHSVWMQNLKTDRNAVIPVRYTIERSDNGSDKAWMYIKVGVRGQTEQTLGKCTKL